ncbi:hypothetical protein IKG54_00140 [Candidatus Saccharibacteria bacterium]|nr:hypothetical protein [Candidatus Saccharibacteria bacterium]
MSSNKHQQLKLHQSFIFNPKHYRLFALGLFAFLCAYVVASTLTPVRESDASTVHITNNTSDFFIDITSADSLPLTVTAKPTGQLAYKADTINVTTNSDNGYKLYVSTSGNDNNIYQNGDPSTSSQGYFGPTAGTIASPTPLAQNTWGFALSKVTDTSDAKYNPIASTFADISAYVNNTEAPTTDSTWAKVPTFAHSDEAKISEFATSNYPAGNSFDIYYGINASTTLPTGDYSTVITYTAISEGVNVFPTMQDFTAEQCYNMAENTSINLSDARDDKYYRVTKMADGHCWMTDNLALDGTDKSGNVRVLTPSDSNVTTNRPLAANITDGTASEYDVVQIYSGVANDVTDSCNLTANPYCIVNTSTKYGNLYNWNAATAGVGKQATTGTITESVCPKGWQLPDRNGIYSYPNLLLHYGLPTSNTNSPSATQASQQAPLYFALTGYYVDSYYTPSAKSSAYYHTRTANSTTDTKIYGFTFSAIHGTFFPQGPDSVKRVGYSVRCVFSGQATDPTMQDFTTTMCSNLAVNSSKVLIDRRNNQFYRVVHAVDGNCWMADNLSIYGQDISATDSDFTTPSTYTIPASITATTDWNTNNYQTKKVEVAHGLGSSATSDSSYYGEVFYNWTVAVAKETTAGVTSAPNTSICPAGWQLPVNGPETTNKSWARLLSSTYGYGITTGTALLENQYLGFTKYYGNWHWLSASEGGQGSYGVFWSGTPSSETNAYYLTYFSGGVTLQDVNNKGYGWSIRCVQR